MQKPELHSLLTNSTQSEMDDRDKLGIQRCCSVAVLMTCFNRRDKTIAALTALRQAATNAIKYKVFLVDDGSTDGTGNAVSKEFPEANIIKGNGNLYWNRGLRLAWCHGCKLNPTFYLWLNDDVVLREGSLAKLIEHYKQVYTEYGPRIIIVGRTISPSTGRTTYGGYVRASRLSRLSFRHLIEGETLCETMNGNCVLIPAAAVHDVGLNCERYSHAFGDIDYGLRARRAGYVIVQYSEPVASLEALHDIYSGSIGRMNFQNMRYVLTHPKGVPIREWGHFCRVHGGILWPANFIWRYLRMMSSRRS
jgi:GT2 family glycosyltransferase